MNGCFSIILFVLFTIVSANAQTQAIVDSLKKNLTLKSTAKDTLALARALNLYGESLAKKNQDDLAQRKFLEVLSFYPQNPIIEELGYTYNNLGTLLSRNNDPGSAIHYTNEAIRVFSSILGSTHLYIGVITKNVAVQTGFIEGPAEGLELLNKSDSILQLHVPAGHQFRLELERLKTQAHVSLKEFDEADRIITKLIQTVDAMQPPNHAERLYAYDVLTNFMLAQPKVYTKIEIKKAFEKCIAFSEMEFGVGHPLLRNIYNNYATYLTHINEQEPALVLFHKAIVCQYPNVDVDQIFDLHNFKDVNNPSLEDLKLLSNKGGLMLDMFEENKEIRYLDNALPIFMLGDSLAARVKFEVLNQSSRFRIKKSYNRFYIFFSSLCVQLFEQTRDRIYLEKLYEILEKIKNWELVEQYKSIEVGHLEQDSFYHKINQLAKGIKGQSNSSSDSLDRIDHAEMQRLFDTNPAYFELLFGFEVSRLEEVEQFCQEQQEQWIHYFYFPSGSIGYVLCTPDTTLLHVEKGISGEVSSNVKQLLQSIEKNIWDFTDPAHRLYKYLIRPIEKYLTGPSLIITPFSTLQSLPFETLLMDSIELNNQADIQQNYLVNKFDIRYQSSGSMGLMTHQSNNTISNVTYFAPQYDAPEMELLWNVQEIAGANESIPGLQKIGEKASSTYFEQAIQEGNLVHFAGHTFTHSNRLDSIFLLFNGGDDTMFMKEILSLESKAPMIILSSCNSATGKGTAEGQMGPSYGFALAGTPNLISTLWRVSDRESATLYEKYYEELAAGSTSSTALTMAKRAYLNEASAPAKHPYFWASPVYYGHPLTYQKRNRVWWWVVGGITLVGVVILRMRLLFLQKNRHH